MIGQLRLLPEALAVFCRHNLLQPLRRRPFPPKSMHFIATHKCNARCTMCGIWMEKDSARDDMALQELGDVLGDRLFERLNYAGISGGEPFLRDDLPEIVELFHRKCRFLKRVSLSTNGILTKRIQSSLNDLIGLSKRYGTKLDFSVSVHGTDGLLSQVYGVDGAFEKISQTLDLLIGWREKNALTVSLNCVLLKGNLDNARALRRWAGERGLAVSFVLGEERERFFNQELREALAGAGERAKIVGFLRDMYEDISLQSLSPIRYLELIGLLEGTRCRSLSCYYAIGGFLLGHDGKLFYCSHSKEIGNCRTRSAWEIFNDPINLRYRQAELFGKECLHCPPYTLTRLELMANLHRILRLMIGCRLGSKRN